MEKWLKLYAVYKFST